MRFKLTAVAVAVGLLATVAVTAGSAADFDVDNGPCRETPSEKTLLRCPSAYVGMPYQVAIKSEEKSGCFPFIWYEIVNSTLPGGMSMTREGVISGIPTGVGFSRFWIWNHDLTKDQGGPSWCNFDDQSEKEFSIPVDPGVGIVTTAVGPGTVGQPYSATLAARRLDVLNPPTGPDLQATWSVQSGVLPPGITLSASGALAGTPTAEGSFQFVVKAQNDTPFDTKTYAFAVRQPLTVTSAPASGQRPSGEVGIPFAKTFTAAGGSGTYTWSLASGALPGGVALDASKGTISGTPQTAGNFAFALTVTDSEGRVATQSAALTVAPKLAIKSPRLKPAKRARTYRATLTTAGGVLPLKWRVVDGRLPVGVRLSSRLGTLAGVPRRVGTFSITVEARDALGAKSQKTFVLNVRR